MVTASRLLALTGAAVFLNVVHAKNYRVTVAAADVDRAAQVVTFKLPADGGKVTSAQPRDGKSLPVQVENGTAAFVIPAQKAGEALVFTLSGAENRAALVEAKAGKGRLHVTIAGEPVLDYQMDKDAIPRPDIKPEYKRAGYLHPIYSPAGTIVSDDYPVQHVHHHGIWSPWTKTSFQGRTPDFWNMGQKSGMVEFVALERTWNGPVHGGFAARHRFVDLSAPSPVVALQETWEVTAYNVGTSPRTASATIFDLLLTQSCATND